MSGEGIKPLIKQADASGAGWLVATEFDATAQAGQEKAAARNSEARVTFDRLRKAPAVLDETLMGFCDSDYGKCLIDRDPIAGRLCYEEPLTGDCRLHGWLQRAEKGRLGLAKLPLGCRAGRPTLA